MPAIQVERFSTAATPSAARLAYWNDLASENFNNLVVDAADPDAFSGVMVRASLGELNLMGAESAAACVNRRNDPFRSARGLSAFDLHFQLAGRSLNSQNGREAALNAGDFTLCDASRPYTVRFGEANHMLCVKVPHLSLAERLGDVEPLLCVPMRGDSGGGAMLSAFLRTLWSQMGEFGDETWASTVSDVILDLIALAYRPVQDRRPALSAQAQWRDKALAYIDQRICDPDLGVSSIGEALGVSPRYVQMLFAAAGATPSAYILDRRLRLAAERLRRAGGQTVTEVALALGFNDLTHFGRAFRRRYGVPPRAYRDGRRSILAEAPALLA